MLYEALLVFGVVFVSGMIFLLLTRSSTAPDLRHMLQLWLFFVVGSYFTFLWRRNGQTLAMKTWRIQLVASDGGGVSLRQAVLRYLLAWMWFLPALVVDFAFGLKAWASIAVIGAGMLMWLFTVRLDPQRQFLHDRLAGTRLVDAPPFILTPA